MKSLPLLLCTSLFLSACASYTPTHIALNPSVPQPLNQIDQYATVAVNTIDVRKANFIVRFNKEGEAAELISPSEPIRQQLDSVFKQAMTKVGYQVDPAATNSAEFQLDYLLTDVTESTFGFEAKTTLTINVVAKNQTQEFTKIYNAKGLLKGPFSPDYATLELDMNKLIDELTSKIINDAELHHFLQQ
ncbi:YajG family lipoprotein [Shewanella sp. UCD-KL21]|uniref:YajG family lipoprotein n=1 Tax=Shewanella sp. UCD-KL21 TaxID=1917164 RepID=UPI000970684D|nr:YajG family lipoprotein [Shewanella sp. UCD-KL21]